MRIEKITMKDNFQLLYIMGEPIVDYRLKIYGVFFKGTTDAYWMPGKHIPLRDLPPGTIVEQWENNIVGRTVL